MTWRTFMGLKKLGDFKKISNLSAKRPEQQLTLTSKEQQEVIFRIEQINRKRLKIVASTAIFLESLLILFYDLPNLASANNPLELTVAYLGAHLFLMAISMIAVLVQWGKRSQQEHATNNTSRYTWVCETFGTLFLSGIAFITGLDQLANSQIVSFIAMFAVGSLLYYAKPPKQIVVLGIPMLCFVVSVWYFQEDSAIAIANIINGLLFAVTMTVMSIYNYYKVKTEISRDILLEVWTRKLDFLAHHDSLTGLFNRRRFDHEVLTLLENGEPKDHFALGIMDLDYFKKLNDDFGHDRADEILIKVATIMKWGVEPGGVVARWGGEEFIFMLKGETFEALVERTQAMRLAIASETIELANETISVTGSFGLTEVRCHEYENLKEKFTLVDAALYASKDAGRNRVTVKM